MKFNLQFLCDQKVATSFVEILPQFNFGMSSSQAELLYNWNFSLLDNLSFELVGSCCFSIWIDDFEDLETKKAGENLIVCIFMFSQHKKQLYHYHYGRWDIGICAQMKQFKSIKEIFKRYMLDLNIVLLKSTWDKNQSLLPTPCVCSVLILH